MAAITGVYEEGRQAWMACERKKPYSSEKLALQVAERATQRAGELIIAYECRYCRQWHIGHADLTQQALRMVPDNGARRKTKTRVMRRIDQD